MLMVLFVFMIAAAGAFACIDSSLVGAALPGIRAEAGLSTWAESAFMALYLVGLALSTAWTGWCLPRIGDRRTLVVGMTAAVAGCIAVAFSGGWIRWLLLGRFVHGLGTGAVFVVLPYMIAGRSPEAIRGRLGVFFQLMVTAGLALGSAIGLAATRFLASESAWRADYLASVPFAVLVGFLALRLPKSVPHSAPVAQPAADGVRARPSVRVLLAVAIPALVQLTGVGVVMCYCVTILGDVGFVTAGANLGDLAVKGLNFAATVAALLLVDSLGRRPLMVGGFAGSAAGLLLAALSLLLPGCAPAWLTVVSFGLFIVAFAIGPGGCTWLVPGELLPEESRSWGLSLAALGSHIASCAVVAAYQPAARAFGPGAVLCAFACLSVGSTVLFACLLPETRAGRRQESERR